MTAYDIKAQVRSIPGYPKDGIIFRDITTLLADARGFRRRYSSRGLVRPERRCRVGAVARGKRGCYKQPSLPALRERRMRWRQSQRVPDYSGGRPGLCGGRAVACPEIARCDSR